ncbi:MAG: hypothetical protein ACN6PD_02480, partial [Sphingobacterium sp.]
MKDATRLTALALGMISMVLLACNPSNANKERTTSVTDVTTDKQQTIPYRLSSGEKINLPDELLEISGIAFLEGQDQDIYAIQDEQGLLFRYNLSTQKLTF